MPTLSNFENLRAIIFTCLYMSMSFQAREDVIGMLKSKQTVPEALESRYGSAVPNSALQALQRDGFIAGTEPHNHSVHQQPLAEVSRQLGVTALLVLSALTHLPMSQTLRG